MFRYVVFGISIVAITVIIHALGTTAWLRYLRRLGADTRFDRPRLMLPVIVTTIVILLVLHTIEIVVWAFAYVSLPQIALNTWEEAVYFSFVTFTTLGYGDITLQGVWRIMSAIEALNGIMLVGWSTALVFAVVQQTWQRGALPTDD